MKPLDDDDGQQGRDVPATLPRLSILLIAGIAAVAAAVVWPNAAPAAELAVTLLVMLLDAMRQFRNRIDRE